MLQNREYFFLAYNGIPLRAQYSLVSSTDYDILLLDSSVYVAEAPILCYFDQDKMMMMKFFTFRAWDTGWKYRNIIQTL